MNEGVRLNKYLASCAVGSRRNCDELIQAGRVEVNGSPCLNMGTRIVPTDHVRVDGKRVRAKESVVIIFHKPRGYVCTREDELGRETIYTLLPQGLRALHHVGRLDRDSEGLLILTNDGDLSQQLMHPSKSVEKEYLVTANQSFENAISFSKAFIHRRENSRPRPSSAFRRAASRWCSITARNARSA